MERTEALLRVRAGAVKIGALGTHVGERERQHQKAQAANDPSDERSTRRGDVSELTGKGEDARADAGGNDHADKAEKADTVGVIDTTVFRHNGHLICC